MCGRSPRGRLATVQKATSTIFTRDFIAVSLINLIMMSAYYMLMVTITSYSLVHLKATHSMAGLIAGSMVLGLLAGRFVSGKLISFIRFRTLLLLGIAEYLIFMACYLLAKTPEQLLLVRFLSGFGVGLVSTVTGTIVATILPKDLLGTGISYYSLSAILATALGPFVGLLMMERYSFEDMFILCLAAGVASGLGVFGLTGTLRLETGTQESERIGQIGQRAEAGEKPLRRKWTFNLEDFIEYRAVPISIVVFLCGFGYSSTQAFIASYAEELDLVAAARLFFIVYAAIILISRPITGRVMDKKGPDVVIYPSLILFACGLFLLSAVHSGWAFLLAGALVGAGFGNFQSTAQALAIKMVPQHRFGHATSTFFIFLDVAVGVGPFLLGFIVSHISYPALYVSMGVLSLACIGAYYIIQAHRPYYGQPQPEVTSLKGGAPRSAPPRRGSHAHAKQDDARTPR